jgi:hypothetical protein
MGRWYSVIFCLESRAVRSNCDSLVEVRLRAYRTWLWMWVGVCAWILAACASQPQAEATPTLTQEGAAAATVTPEQTATLEPSPTAAQPVYILVAGPESDAELASQLSSTLSELAAAEGADLEVRAGLQPSEIGSNVRGVILLPPDPGTAALSSANPTVPFLAVGIPDLVEGGNLTVIDGAENRPDQASFLAGYLGAVVTPDWRLGVIVQGDDPTGQSILTGYTNGMVFFCGLCRPAYPPFVTYPVVVNLPSSVGEADFAAAAQTLSEAGVATVYLPYQLPSQELAATLAGKGLQLVGQENPPPGVEASWLASIQADLLQAVQQAWPEWSTGGPGVRIIAPVGVTYANTDLFSIGRQNMVKQLQEDLQNDRIDTGVNLVP